MKTTFDKDKAKKTKLMLDYSIPRLTILYTFKNMRAITVAKLEK